MSTQSISPAIQFYNSSGRTFNRGDVIQSGIVIGSAFDYDPLGQLDSDKLPYTYWADQEILPGTNGIVRKDPIGDIYLPYQAQAKSIASELGYENFLWLLDWSTFNQKVPTNQLLIDQTSSVFPFSNQHEKVTARNSLTYTELLYFVRMRQAKKVFDARKGIYGGQSPDDWYAIMLASGAREVADNVYDWHRANGSVQYSDAVPEWAKQLALPRVEPKDDPYCKWNDVDAMLDVQPYKECWLKIVGEQACSNPSSLRAWSGSYVIPRFNQDGTRADLVDITGDITVCDPQGFIVDETYGEPVESLSGSESVMVFCRMSFMEWKEPDEPVLHKGMARVVKALPVS